MVICPKCGEEIRYINSASNREGMFVVNPTPHEIISERGRVVKGFFPHACKGVEDGKASGQTSGEKR